jgi:hypothetical protein
MSYLVCLIIWYTGPVHYKIQKVTTFLHYFCEGATYQAVFRIREAVEKEVTFLAVPILRFHSGGRNVTVDGDSRHL